ncbi:vWA domain-containing protein [Lentibacillus jeotgali]|uniref:vWA domain-containing protein n=1 Tax=Lentibacillus jeotgali TaxID=558169 RepID=UPI00026260B9|nr:VWA domain-containing protein [Lentibacillus jeotgali]
MKKDFVLGFLVISVCFLLVACGSDEQTASSEEKQESKQSEEGKTKEVKESPEEDFEVATTIEEIIEQDPGKYAGNKYNEAVVHRALDEKNFQDKDSFQVFAHLLSLVSESGQYKAFHSFAEEFNPQIETAVSETPGSMELDNGETVNGTANIAILLDASGSMAQKINGTTKMKLAKEAINDFVASLPEAANVSLRVYGHKGSNADSDKEVSCDSSELVYELQSYDKGKFQDALDKFEPTGWTPIANSISLAKEDFETAESASQNTIYIVSDGVETCDGNPVEAAKELHDSNIEAVVNIIGFDVDSNGQKELLEVAEAGGGEFKTVDSGEDFQEVWEDERVRLYNEWSSWNADNYNNVSGEQTDKKNELYGKKSDFMNLTYDEESHLKDAVYYLEDNEQISDEAGDELMSLIDQRQGILADYEETFNSLLETVDEEGDQLKDDINEKGDEMKEKYDND